MSISSGTILKVVVSLLMPDSVIAQNIFYTVVTDLITSDDEGDVVSDIQDWVEAMYAPLNNYIVLGVEASDFKVYEYDPIDDDWDEVGADTWVDGFANASDMIPHGVAAISHAKTIDPDVQGTKFIPGFGDTVFIESDLSAGGVTAMGNFNDVWVTPFGGTATGGDFVPGIWSTVGVVFKLFNGNWVVNGVAGYQRRRKPGVGI